VKKLIKSSKKLPVVKFTDSLKENVASGWIEL
jgi:hypothetical protein